MESTNTTTTYSSTSATDASLLELDMKAITDALMMLICAFGIVTLGSTVPSQKQVFQAIMIQSVCDQLGRKNRSSCHTVRFYNSQQVLRLLLTCERILGVNKHKNSTIILKKWQIR